MTSEAPPETDFLAEATDLLLAAGYFRVRIARLTAFDRIVGGMSWCLSTASAEVDIDLFREESKIGEKIKISENICRALQKLRCPHPLQPHQIQGEDYVNIFPVVQWLVKKAIEAREASADFIRNYSAMQFHKHFELPSDREYDANKDGSLAFLSVIGDRYKPKRRFKQTQSAHQTPEQRVQSTLLEYGRASRLGRQAEEKDQQSKQALARGPSAEEEAAQEEKRIRELMGKLDQIEEGKLGRLSTGAVGAIVGLQSEEIKQATAEYLEQTKALGLNEAQAQKVLAEATHSRMVQSGQKRLQQLEERLAQAQSTHADNTKQLEEAQAQLAKRTAFKERIQAEIERLQALETPENAQNINSLKALVALNESLKAQEADFKANCKRQLAELKGMIASLQESAESSQEAQRLKLLDETLEQELARQTKARQLLNQKARELVTLQRKIDEVPSRTELVQYERRFLELYEQVASKLIETRKYYQNFNVLEDVKTILQKETSILQSVEDNLKAMTAKTARDKLTESLENIVSSVKQNLEKVNNTNKKEKGIRDDINSQYLAHLEKQRAYFKAVKDFQEECRKNEALRAHE